MYFEEVRWSLVPTPGPITQALEAHPQCNPWIIMPFKYSKVLYLVNPHSGLTPLQVRFMSPCYPWINRF